MDEFPIPRPAPGGSRQPPDKPPQTAIGLGGPQDDDSGDQRKDRRSRFSAYEPEMRRRGLRLEALGVARDLFEIAERIGSGAKDRPDLDLELLEMQKDCLELLDRALDLARGK